MNDPGIVAATFPPANPLRTPFGKPRPAEIAHTSQGSMPAAALKYAASFCFFFVNEILIKLQAKKEFAQQVWQAHIYRTPLLRLLLTGIPLSFTSRQIAGSFIRDAPVHAAYA